MVHHRRSLISWVPVVLFLALEALAPAAAQQASAQQPPSSGGAQQSAPRQAALQRSATVAGGAAAAGTAVVLTALSSPANDPVSGQLASTITQSVALVLHMTGSLTVERADFLTPTLSFTHALRYYHLVKAGGAVFGSVAPGAGGGYTVTLDVWNAASSAAEPTVLERSIDNPLDAFALADRLSLEVASTVVGRRLSEGTLVVDNTDILPHYSVYADGHLLGRNRSRY